VTTATAAQTLAERLRVGSPRLSVGMLTADLGHLQDQLDLAERESAELVHIDVMDGVFVPTLTVGAPVVRAIRGGLLKDVHLMIQDPLSKVDAFLEAGADLVTIHVESTSQPLRVLQALGSARNTTGRPLRGVAVAPSTPVDVVEPLLDETDYLLVLAVNPGWGGQSFLPSTRRRVERARKLIAASGRPILLGVDGGVTAANIESVLELGTDIVVTGSAIFDGRDPAGNARAMLATVDTARRRRA
jgi:ribulose-phosphate 3-epimerase